MAVLEIDGIGKVEVGNEFLSLPPDRQAAEVDAIAAQIRPRAAPAPATPAPAGNEFAEQADAAAAIQGRQPNDVVDRATFLPMGKTAEGNITLAIPGFIQGPMQTIADIMSGKKTSQDVSGQEMFELGGLFAGISAATGTGRGIAGAARGRAGAPAEAVAPEASAVEAAAARPPAAAVAPEATAPQVAVTESAQRGRREGRFVDFEIDGVGKLTTKVEGDGLTVAEGSAFVSPEHRGQGNAVALYERAVQWAADNGLKFRSDFTVEPEAVQVYRALERRGYPVREQTETRAQPRFEVGPKPGQTAPVAEAAAAPSPATRGALHSTPETLALRGEAKGGFKTLDESNVVLNPQSFKAVTQEIFSDAAMKGLDETITPSSVAVIKRLQNVADEPITLQSLNTLREVANGAAGSKVPKDRMIAERIIEKLDDYMGGLKAKDLVLGSEVEAKAVAEAVNGARATWAVMSKLETVSRLVQRAKDAEAQRPALGLENTLRNEFTQLAKNDREMRKLTSQERAAVRQVTRGATKTTMRALGRLAPTGPVSGAVAGGLAVGLGAKLGLDPMASMVVIGAPAFAARKLAAVLTNRSVKNLENVIKSRNDPAALAALDRGRSISDQLGSSLTVSATTQKPKEKR